MSAVVCLSATEPGRAVAMRLPYRHRHGDLRAAIESEWPNVGGIVLVLAVGAAVRLVAPLLSAKGEDPGVVCVDDSARFAVALCGGHAGGANALAVEVAGLLGAQPVVTTATDRLGIPALDMVPGFVVEGAVALVTAAALAGRPLLLDNAQGWPLPEPVLAMTSAGPDAGGGAAGRILVTDRAGGPDDPSRTPTVLLRPRSLVVGIGTSTDAAPDDALAAVGEALEGAHLSAKSAALLATVDRRTGHPAVEAVAGWLAADVVAFTAGELDAVVVPSPSDAVRRVVGTGSVAEAAALLAAGPGAVLVAPKRTTARVTVAVARRRRPAGSVAVVGLGPGGAALRTPAAVRAVRHAEVVIGYAGYVEQCADLLSPAQDVRPYPLGAEVERARVALAEAAAGHRVAVVCSGDPGVYAMASPVLELAPGYPGVVVQVVPGVTAGSAAAALLGAPLGHDHAVVSLSDLHTPWSRIAARLEAAAASDLVVVLYNPRSTRRTWQLEAARAILLDHRPATTPVGLVADAGRRGERVRYTSLGELPVEEVTMTTCVVIGSRTTGLLGGRMVTPRGYGE